MSLLWGCLLNQKFMLFLLYIYIYIFTSENVLHFKSFTGGNSLVSPLLYFPSRDLVSIEHIFYTEMTYIILKNKHVQHGIDTYFLA